MLLLPENIGVACLDMLPPATIASKLSLLCSALIFPTLLRFPLDFVPGTFGLEPDEENLSMLAAIPVRGFFFSDPSLLPRRVRDAHRARRARAATSAPPVTRGTHKGSGADECPLRR